MIASDGDFLKERLERKVEVTSLKRIPASQKADSRWHTAFPFLAFSLPSHGDFRRFLYEAMVNSMGYRESPSKPRRHYDKSIEHLFNIEFGSYASGDFP